MIRCFLLCELQCLDVRCLVDINMAMSITLRPLYVHQLLDRRERRLDLACLALNREQA